MKHIAIIRLSALGDVAMCVPVVDSLARRYPDLKFTVVTRKNAARLFYDLPKNVDTLEARVKSRHKGILGLLRLARDLRKKGVDTVADLHDVLRTKAVRKLMLLQGCRVRHVKKYRAARRSLIAHKLQADGSLFQLPTGTERYADVFRKLGLNAKVDFRKLSLKPNTYNTHKPDGKLWIGVAPFAAHRGKIYSLRRLKEVVGALLARYDNLEVLMFGTEKEMKSLRSHYDFDRLHYVCDMPGGLWQELRLIDQLDLMISMDSANMHIASLTATPVVSIWGATHPAAGFMGYGQDPANAIGRELDCRPCSIYGQKPCRRGDYDCLRAITSKEIVDKAAEIISKLETGKDAAG